MTEKLTRLKLLLVGDLNVGKSSIFQCFISDTTTIEYAQTIGLGFLVKTVTVNDAKWKLFLWDTAGQEKFGYMTRPYYRDAHGVILVYDISCGQSFRQLEKWLQEIDRYATKPNIIKMAVGNKIDKDSLEREVSHEDGLQFAEKHQMLFMETSAKRPVGVQTAFEELTKKIIETPSLWEDDNAQLNVAERVHPLSCSYC